MFGLVGYGGVFGLTGYGGLRLVPNGVLWLAEEGMIGTMLSTESG